ncbi:hypothetical protein GCM10009654_15270 [Streptomyces hebeiensis]|uniref:Uncharacterized protein n=1 Tax=Streptomyces hebeiensis TaxID=229486 RepID=A0ABN1UQI3_9ACTN
MRTDLADWYLVREQFEPVIGIPGLYRLTHPEQDGARRTRQAVHDLRRHGFEVQADYSLDPALTPDPPQPAVRNTLMERRQRIAQASAARSPQRGTPPTTSAPSARPIPAKPTHAPTVHLTTGRGR